MLVVTVVEFLETDHFFYSLNEMCVYMCVHIYTCTYIYTHIVLRNDKFWFLDSCHKYQL